MPANLDYAANTYLAVSLAPSSSYMRDPAALAALHPALAYAGQVGPLADVQLLAVPKVQWESVSEDVVGVLSASGGVHRVDVQQPRMRAKRDEL